MGPHDAMLLRPARAADAPRMAAMSRDLIETGLSWRYSATRIARLIADRETIGLVACDAAGVQGYAVMQFGDRAAHLVLLCVRPAYRRRGIGRRLLEWLLASARVAGIETIDLELRADNAAGHAFYLGLGFAETGLAAGYYEGRVAARRMQLRLAGGGAAPR